MGLIISRKIFIILISIFICLYILFYIKYSVHNLSYQKNELEKLVRSLNLENMVQFLGKRRDIPEFLHAIDAFALTSKYEGLGLVLLEALASEVPIIAARNSAIKEIVNDEVALMFETSSVSGLEKAMRDLINDPNETSHRVQRGNVRVQQKFGIDSMLKQVANIYTHILKDGLK